ncbi:hypothetical protein LTR36_008852 [Oleoguttula mirabilis]|uniref:SPT2 chromatin protein n=1 Tax=Oleoguttula mirabilis TaxID=1507867 RepID=A0AAV9J7A3_9PEZI|nr:hypothetical protein LTR36_008852 [Oleoguttula mirabilis]
MTSFSSLFSSLGEKPQAPNQSSSNVPKPTSTQPTRKPNGATDRFKLTPTNAVAGVKRKSQEPESAPRPKIIKTEQQGLPTRPAVPGSRFQLSAKPSAVGRPVSAAQRPAIATASNATSHRALPKQTLKPVGSGALTPPGTADGSAKPKKGFAAMLEKAKAAEAAAKTAGGGGIKHKAVEKLSRRERERIRDEALAQQKAARKGQLAQANRSKSGTPNGAAKPSLREKVPESTYKGTMKKAVVEPVAYKGTMGKVRSGPQPAPKKGRAQDKYGGYASWSDLDDAEEEPDEPDDYDSEDDMEGGFDDLEAEETAALRVARKEDQQALEEEEQLKREKLERKKRLEALSKSAAARKKF